MQTRKISQTRIAIEAGVAALERGDHTEVEDQDLDAYLDELAAAPDERLAELGIGKRWQTGPSATRWSERK